MLTKTQIIEAEGVDETPNSKHQTPSPQLEVLSPRLEAVLAVTGELEGEAAAELSRALQHIERRDRRSARACIGRAIEKLNEAEIED